MAIDSVEGGSVRRKSWWLDSSIAVEFLDPDILGFLRRSRIPLLCCPAVGVSTFSFESTSHSDSVVCVLGKSPEVYWYTSILDICLTKCSDERPKPHCAALFAFGQWQDFRSTRLVGC
ncbi:hypothetical protein RchiOBHm_Chr7g0177201 [Rosa chinensis]|uniref:Uncharacterized protein n=1 Tax=Rosa chinensis TaxID=74649 RepID=A0A2P6P1H6_ROSCH|nr:uncharacterized protein LOC112179021 [Rosa chinensis]PRQ15783.1 hypothetical protein RchiOBHm_Chr7g0177201 [Rosa chinensis]